MTLRTCAQIPKYRLPDEFNTYFLGRWLGTGKFASGKGIAADLSFKMALDNNWIIYEHTDQHPDRFKSLSIWGIDPKTGQFLAYSFDNFSGHKVFHSDGWKNGNLVLTTNLTGAIMTERFIYTKISEKSFRMTYETSKDSLNWKFGDSLIFKKVL